MKVFLVVCIFLTFDVISSAQYFTEVQQPTTNGLYSGSAYYTSYQNYGVWVCGAVGSVFRGRMNTLSVTWINTSGNMPAGVTLVTISALDTLKAIAGGNIGSTSYIYRTTNGGTNWTQTFSEPNGRINALWMRDTLKGIAVGNPVGGRWSIWRTTTGGASWDSAGRYLPVAGSETGFNNSLWCIGDTIFFGTNNSRIYYSSNYGVSWSAQLTSPDTVTSAIYLDFWYNFNNSILVAGGGGSFLESTNYGSSWNLFQNVPGTGNITGFCSNTPGVDYVTDYYLLMTKGNKIYQTPYSGSYWGTINTSPSGNYTYIFQKKNEPPPAVQASVPQVAIRDNGGVSICFMCRWGGISSEGSNIPEDYSLYQNYPNPFNPKTVIRFQVASDKYVTLKIFDALGKEVATLVDQQLQPGIYETDWDGTNYPSGVYYYQLSVGNEELATKKMVLIK